MPEARVEPPGRGADAGREVGRRHLRAEGRAWDRLVPGSVQSIALEAEHKRAHDTCLPNSYPGALAFQTSSSNSGSRDLG